MGVDDFNQAEHFQMGCLDLLTTMIWMELRMGNVGGCGWGIW